MGLWAQGSDQRGNLRVSGGGWLGRGGGVAGGGGGGGGEGGEGLG